MTCVNNHGTAWGERCCEIINKVMEVQKWKQNE